MKEHLIKEISKRLQRTKEGRLSRSNTYNGSTNQGLQIAIQIIEDEYNRDDLLEKYKEVRMERELLKEQIINEELR